VEINLGTSLCRQDRPAEAEGMYRRAARRFAELGDIELSLMADIGVANTLTWQFRLDEALAGAAAACEKARGSGYAILHGPTLEQARLLARAGRYEAAQGCLARTRQLYVALENVPSIALTDLCKARVELAIGRIAEALQAARQAADSLQQTGIKGWWLQARV